MKFEQRQETRSRELKVKGSITAEIDLFVAAVGATIELGIENQEKLTTDTMQCEFMGNFTGEDSYDFNMCINSPLQESVFPRHCWRLARS